MIKQAIERSSLASLAGLIVHYLSFYALGTPLLTEAIAETIMARTPSRYAVVILGALGAWAKPFAITGALALLGFALFLAIAFAKSRRIVLPKLATLAALIAWAFHYTSPLGNLSFWLPAALLLIRPASATWQPSRRQFFAMSAGTIAVAAESYLRDRTLARRAVTPVALFPFTPPLERFSPGLVRRAVTPTPEFYGMSKNTVDPAIDPRSWRLRITANGRTLQQYTYAQLLTLPREQRYITLRCVSNTLKSDLMGTAAWSGIHLAQLVDRAKLPPGIFEAAIIGIDGHGDSLSLDYAFSGEPLLALGMNGKTLDRTHGFPIRLLAPRYYGFKNVKWISEIAFVSQPYYGTWPKLGYTREPLIHTASHIDQVRVENRELIAAGVSFAGMRGVREVRLRLDTGNWQPATLEEPLSQYAWTRWSARLPLTPGARIIEARALDGQGHWQESVEGPLFPDGVSGPTMRRIS